jgi:hypothetical protein
MTKTDSFTLGGGWDHIRDLNLLTCDHNTVNEQLDELAFLLKGCFTDPLLYALAESFYRLDHCSKLIVVSHIGIQLTLLLRNHRQTLLQLEPAPLVLFELKHIGQRGIGETLHLLLQAHPRRCRTFSRRACNS